MPFVPKSHVLFAQNPFDCYYVGMKRAWFIGLILFFLSVAPAQAIYNPLSVPNNRFGIHIIDENDLTDAVRLVNSSGGQWGYVKLVIREDDRDKDKWQAILDNMRRLHVIPLIRLATKVENGVWVKPRVADIGSWVDFLSSLNWVVENRYVIIFNEPNHAKEWGGETNPEEYAWYVKEFSRRLKDKSPDFFILPAGLDASAPNGTETMDEQVFIERMVRYEPDVFSFIDGWSSHSYPNPDFSGSPLSFGRGTVRTYQWEMELLANYFNADLPVFITETGWKHREGINEDRSYITSDQAGTNLRTAYEGAWNDARMVTTVPFLLNYQGVPFDRFSWRAPNSETFYSIYNTVAGLPKVSGKPKQKHAVKLFLDNFPKTLVVGSEYSLPITFENTGQSIVEPDSWKIELSQLPAGFEAKVAALPTIEPFTRGEVNIHLNTPNTVQSVAFAFMVKQKDELVTVEDATFMLKQPPSLLLQAKVWFNRLAEGTDFRLSLFDEKKQLLETRTIIFTQGEATVPNVRNVIPGQVYRLELKKPFYLPRQMSLTLGEMTTVQFPQLLPFDPSDDGMANLADMKAILRSPFTFFRRILAL